MKRLIILSLILSLAALAVAWRATHPDIGKILEDAKRQSDELIHQTIKGY